MRRPLFLILAILIVLAGLSAWELPNYLRKPSLRTYLFESEGRRIDVFSDGVRDRKAAMFFSRSGQNVLLDVLDPEGKSLNGGAFGSLRWTRDRTALVATELGGGGIESDRPIWVFDVERMFPVTSGREAVIGAKGGLGDRVFSWFDLGRSGRFLFSWQADRWREEVNLRMRAAKE